MNRAETFSEAWRNIMSGASRAVWFAFALAFLGSGLGIADIAATQSLISQANSYKGSGANVTTFVAAGAIDGEKCEQLAGLPGVTAAGALRSAPDAKFLALPGSTVPAKEVTSGFLRFFGAQASAEVDGIVVSNDVAEALDINSPALEPKQRIETEQGTAVVRGVYDYPADGRRAGFAYGILVPVPAISAFDECWVSSWPQHPELRTLIRLSMIPAEDEPNTDPPVVGQLNTRNGLNFDGAAQFDQRITRLGAMAALAVGVVLGYLSVRARRLELASAKHSGVTTVGQTVQIAIECGVIGLMSWILAIPLILYASGTVGGQDLLTIRVLGIKPPLMAAMAFMIGATAAVGMTRERHLFRYFKNR
ncbi:hypothetical protein [Arthrobacter sp. AZCC_0090]|uniref:hypothetical protein n=1 Tax=Arthrobacter sp. AZCC_0090 TaxID=2735881 RepID=UPI00160CD019|nr:hypothetical protein [Arthrobacter sp. AZCC_0090]MBB6406684.1 hypothetical protein [Arthrobacter sp. AZCC_0090]